MTDATAWIRARWAELARQIDAAPASLRPWARRQLTADPVGRELASAGQAAPDDAPDAYDRARDPEVREALGQVFTPPELARLLVEVAGVGEAEGGWPTPRLLDPACGDGSVLEAALDARLAAGWAPARALAAVEGWDKDPAAAWSCRATLVAWALEHAGRGAELPDLAVHGGVDALAAEGLPAQARGGVGAVVTNPPYLEAKRMNRAIPGLRDRLRERFPQLHGAWDLYVAFTWLALELVGEGGSIALLLPAKVLQARYGAELRHALTDPGSPFHLADLVDLTRLRPRPFPGTSVYPAILHLVRRPVAAVRAHRVVEPADLQVAPGDWQRVPLAELARVDGEDPLFVPFKTWPDLAPTFAGARLGEVASVVSTCSFHRRGLRERFVTPEPRGPEELCHPYLGGPSRARRTEVAPFRTRWAGWWISFDQQELRERWSNPLPDLQHTFKRPKAIFCQHAPRMRVVADPHGRFVTKDVYPVAWPTHPSWTLERLVAVLQSTVFTALYNTVYQGIVVGGETYHYLPAFLKTVPVPPGDHPALRGADDLVRALHEEPDPARWDALDRQVAAAYGLDEAARQRLLDVHLRRVGAEVPGAPRG